MQSAATPISVCSENCLTLACLQLTLPQIAWLWAMLLSASIKQRFCLSASNDIPRVGGHGSNRRKQRFKLLF